METSTSQISKRSLHKHASIEEFNFADPLQPQSMIITNTPYVYGYTIKEYLQPVIGSDIYVPESEYGYDSSGGKKQSSLLSETYSNAISSMRNATPPSANAIIGVSTAGTAMPNGTVFLYVTGTAVRIKRRSDEEESPAQYEEISTEEKGEALERNDDKRINDFFTAITDYKRFMDIYREWGKQGLSGDPAYSEIENELIIKTDIERMYGFGKNTEAKVKSFVDEMKEKYEDIKTRNGQ